MKIITNNQRRELYFWDELPQDIQIEVGGEQCICDSFFKYKGQWYNLNEFLVTDIGDTLKGKGWEAIAPQSAFHGVVLKLVDSSQNVIVGELFS